MKIQHLLSFAPWSVARTSAIGLAWLCATAAARNVTLSNMQPKLDQNGSIIELGDDSLARFGGRFYWYGVRYVCTPSPHTPLFYGCPKQDRRIWGNMSFGVAYSADMVSWRVESYNILPEMHDEAAVYPASRFAYFMDGSSGARIEQEDLANIKVV